MRKKLTSTLSTFSAITGSPATTLPGSSEPRLANPTLGAISRVVRVFLKRFVERRLVQGGQRRVDRDNQLALWLKVTQTQLFQIRRQLPAPSTLPLFLSTRCTLREKSGPAAAGRKTSAPVAAPSSCTSEASRSVSALPRLFPPAPPAGRGPVLPSRTGCYPRLAPGPRPAVYRCHHTRLMKMR